MMNNETIGISCEVAIAECFNIEMSSEYKKRADFLVVEKLKKLIPEIFEEYSIPKPKKHTAENRNPYDFLLEGEKTLSVKSNINKLGKAAPTKIGQVTSQAFFEKFNSYFKNKKIPDNYEKRAEIFKKFVLENIELMLNEYLKNLFETDYYIHFYNFNSSIQYIVIEKDRVEDANFLGENYNFTRTFDKWNESTTVKLDNNSIGEFQVHRNRDCFKFRFNMKNLIKLLEDHNGY